MSNDIQAVPTTSSMPAVASELTIPQLVERVAKIREAISAVCIPGVDLIKIPGVDKPVASKSFAEKIATLFMFAPSFHIVTDKDGDHREVTATCTLTHAPSGTVVAVCQGSCSTMESKYRWRSAERRCPKCGAAAIIKGKAEYGGGFLCFGRKGGCGAKFQDNDPSITGQTLGRVENPDIADTYNTVSKMAQKRAFVGAVLIASGASAHATQDLDDAVAHDEPAAAPPAEDMMPRATVADSAPNPGEVAVTVVAVETKTGETNGKPWKKHGVKVRHDDGVEDVLGTFHDTPKDVATSLVGKRAWVAVTSKEKDGRTLLTLESIRPC